MSDADLYLSRLFGDSRGYVSTAYKDPDESWQEHQFQWPRDRSAILKWAQIHKDANIFICPALRRDRYARRKRDGIHLGWLWADVDMEKVGNIALVNRRIEQLGTLVVASGSGQNRHVYVQLSEEVSVEQHYQLNAGLRAYLMADAKHADNSLLRLPGFTNWKTRQGRPVRIVGGNDRVRTVEGLMKLSSFANAPTMDEGVENSEWQQTTLEGIPRKYVRMARMSVEEAVGRYGNRHKAVWAVTKDMVKGSLTPDQIHTLMDTFPAAESKRDDEHGAYDVHKDVSRCIKSIGEVVAPEVAPDDEGAFEELSGEESDALDFQEGVAKRIRAMDMADEAKRQRAERNWREPPEDICESALTLVNEPPDDVPYAVDQLLQAESNMTLVSQYKAGKTTLVLANLLRSFTDETPFLGDFKVSGGMHVGFWNCEMSRRMAHDYIVPAGYSNPERLHLAHLRGQHVNILTDHGRRWTVDWLKRCGIKVWAIDSLARLASMAGCNENANEEMGPLFQRIDEIKAEAGVDICIVITHTGRAEMEEGSERARAATVIDDWPDARWLLVKRKDSRFLRVDGRDVELEETLLSFDKETKHLTMGYGNRHEAETEAGVETVVQLVSDNNGQLSKTALKKALAKVLHMRTERVGELVEEAEECNRIYRMDPKTEMRCRPDTVDRSGKYRYFVTTGRLMDFRKADESRSQGGSRSRRSRSVRSD